MQEYNEGFARAFNTRFSGFARRIAPLICDFYSHTSVGEHDKSLLDLGCGTGHLALHFLERGYRVIGLDLSEHMLKYANENARQYVHSGQAKFIQATVSDFTLRERFGLVVSTFDTLNHLESEQVLQRCFECVRRVCNAYFIFDMNTKKGVGQCNNIMLDDSNEEVVAIHRGFYDPACDRGWSKITGFVRLSSGLFERFDQAVYQSVFEMSRVQQLLFDTGWAGVRFASTGDLRNPISIGAVEEEARVIVLASAQGA